MSGAEYAPDEKRLLLADYKTAPKTSLLNRLPNRTWSSIRVKARKMGLRRDIHYNRFIPIFNEDIAYILGAMVGDGCAYEVRRKVRGNHGVEKAIELCAGPHEYAFAASFQSALKRLRLHSYLQHRRNTWEVRAYSRSFVDWIKNLSRPELKKLFDAHFSAFLRGFYQAEGSICRPKKETCKRRGTGWRSRVQLRIYNTEKWILHFITQRLVKCGIKAKIYSCGRGRGNLRMVVIAGVSHVKNFLRVVNPVIKNQPWT